MKVQKNIPIVVLSFLFSCQFALGSTLDVPHDFYSIKEALVHSQRGDQVKIQPGRYYELDLVVPPGVTVSGMGEVPGEVILDAQGRGRIMLCESLDQTTIIQNLTFANGSATGTSVYDQSGGAILMSNSSLRLVNCHFINNSAEGHGGAIRCSHATPQILNCRFDNNTAAGGGGALDCSYQSSPVIQSCFFKENTGLWGGGISCRGNSSPILFNCGFDRNRAQGSLGYGGAVMADFEARPQFEQCTFYANEARYGGALACFESAQTNLKSCTLVGNASQWLGAGLLCNNSFPTIDSSIFAFQEGSAVACGGSALPIISCTNIFGNTQGNWIGAIAAQQGTHGNLSADPLFCNLDPENVFQFLLQDNSPSAGLDSGCPLMGAWPANCEFTPTEVTNFAVEWDQNVPRISWQVPDRSDGHFTLTRSLGEELAMERPIPYERQSGGLFLARDLDLVPQDGETYTYRLYHIEQQDEQILVGQIQLSSRDLPLVFKLSEAWPNPFNPRTTISFETATERTIAATVHDIRGHLVKTLAQEVYPPGRHQLAWNGTDEQGRRVESGTYFITLRAESLVRTRKVLMLK